MEAIDIPATNRDKSHVNLITKKSRLDELKGLPIWRGERRTALPGLFQFLVQLLRFPASFFLNSRSCGHFFQIPPFSWQEFNWALMITCFLRTSIKSWNSVRSGRWFVSRKSTQFSFDGTGKIDGFDWTVETFARRSAAAERCERVNVPLDELSIEWTENDSTFHSARKRSTEHFRRFRCGDGETAENLKKVADPVERSWR